MPDIGPQITAILRKYMADPAGWVAPSTTLSELGVDELDLPMIYLDIEEIFDVTIRCNDEIGEPITAGGLVARVAAGLEAKVSRLPGAPRPKRSWVSTVAVRGR
jgi:hypothetical protein